MVSKLMCHSEIVSIVENGHDNTSSNPCRYCLLSLSANTFGKGVNPIILPPFMGK